MTRAHPKKASKKGSYLTKLSSFDLFQISEKRFPFSTKFFLRSGRNRVNLPSYESKTTDKREQNDRRADKNLDGLFVCFSCFPLLLCSSSTWVPATCCTTGAWNGSTSPTSWARSRRGWSYTPCALSSRRQWSSSARRDSGKRKSPSL